MSSTWLSRWLQMKGTGSIQHRTCSLILLQRPCITNPTAWTACATLLAMMDVRGICLIHTLRECSNFPRGLLVFSLSLSQHHFILTDLSYCASQAKREGHAN